MFKPAKELSGRQECSHRCTIQHKYYLQLVRPTCTGSFTALLLQQFVAVAEAAKAVLTSLSQMLFVLHREHLTYTVANRCNLLG